MADYLAICNVFYSEESFYFTNFPWLRQQFEGFRPGLPLISDIFHWLKELKNTFEIRSIFQLHITAEIAFIRVPYSHGIQDEMDIESLAKYVQIYW